MTIKKLLLSIAIIGFMANNAIAMEKNEKESKATSNETSFLEGAIVGGISGFLLNELFQQPKEYQKPQRQRTKGPKIFDHREYTYIDGDNTISMYLACGEATYPAFGKTSVFHYNKNNEYEYQGTLKDIRKNPTKLKKLKKRLRANDAIFCPNVTEISSHDDTKYTVGAIGTGLQNLNRCPQIVEEYAKMKNQQNQ